MLGYFISHYILRREPDRENKMRYNEANIQPPKGKAKEDKPREMPKPGSYTAEDLTGGKKVPKKGGNYRG